MPEIKIPKAYRVDIIESERGYGQKIDEVKFFDNEEEAKERRDNSFQEYVDDGRAINFKL